MFDAVGSSKFDTMVCGALLRWSRFIEIVMEPADSTQWGVALLGLYLLNTVNATDKIMFVYDTKCISDPLMMDRIRHQFRHPTAFSDMNFTAILDGVFGDPNEDPTIRSDTTPFCLNQSASMLVAFDGRIPSAYTNIAAMSKNTLHPLPQYRGSVFPFRLLYSNKEFPVGQHPEPL
jgi:hypothetical protein